jgi:predicted AlkP superfamily phosphohydrolase/phosphomutase
MGEALVQAISVRSRAAQWLATDRLRDWDFFMAVAGEAHGTIEGLWHGVDPSHPLHDHPSAPAAARTLRDVHRALDRMVGDLVRVAGDAAIVAFAMGGMGANHSDAQSMVLLPELLYRHAFGGQLLTVRPEWAAAPNRLPILAEEDSWEAASKAFVPRPMRRPAPASPAVSDGALHRLVRRLPTPIRSALKRGRTAVLERRSPDRPRAQLDLLWQPAHRYRDHWSRMQAFALPSYYDGRIRINLQGRERNGLVDPARYDETCKALEKLLHECRDPRTHEPVVDFIERPWTRDPLALTGTEADLLVIWRGVTAAFEHPRLGLIGPVPLRRTGGHTGRHGVAYVVAPGLEPRDGGVRPSFDVLPTMVELLGRQPPSQLKGTKLLSIS